MLWCHAGSMLYLIAKWEAIPTWIPFPLAVSVALGSWWLRQSFGLTVCSRMWYNCMCASSGPVSIGQPEQTAVRAKNTQCPPISSQNWCWTERQLLEHQHKVTVRPVRSLMSGIQTCHPVTQRLPLSSSKGKWCRGICYTPSTGNLRERVHFAFSKC